MSELDPSRHCSVYLLYLLNYLIINIETPTFIVFFSDETHLLICRSLTVAGEHEDVAGINRNSSELRRNLPAFGQTLRSFSWNSPSLLVRSYKKSQRNQC
ncbi:hypothetical protein HanXRQr2_Chr11g0474501 [Helianthus annuus]|uniref:Uncharacterized protein n=1 Tax=Helianthus annuus TaxID=4232 RepID=A0A9K3MYS6_HELAN|nr:hypothetical protein HanXRQr2_Chr11g0474501 [Helianthus annuus]KAJ0516281.1 hypothetical protein HanHA89_Chr11g0412111 [Helianthus annuus]KAJ0873877.1 hypothetical protein HanPSC8_Chr11g0457531 [Helianthus annuus]